MAEVGFTGTRRYLAAPAAGLCVIAGVGFASLLAAVPERRRLAAAGVIAALALVPALLRARDDARALSVAREQAGQLSELRAAVDEAGGRGAVLRAGDPAINPWIQTAFAWRLHVPLNRVQATWASSSATRTGNRRRSSSARRRGSPVHARCFRTASQRARSPAPGAGASCAPRRRRRMPLP
jgi:hypothetical protein